MKTWMNLRGILLSERSQSGKGKYATVPLTNILGKQNYRQYNKGSGLPQGQGSREETNRRLLGNFRAVQRFMALLQWIHRSMRLTKLRMSNTKSKYQNRLRILVTNNGSTPVHQLTCHANASFQFEHFVRQIFTIRNSADARVQHARGINSRGLRDSMSSTKTKILCQGMSNNPVLCSAGVS